MPPSRKPPRKRKERRVKPSRTRATSKPPTHPDPKVAAWAGQLGIHVLVDLVLNGQLVQFLPEVLPDLDQRRVILAAGAHTLCGVQRMFDSPPRQMGRQGPATMRPGLALGTLPF